MKRLCMLRRLACALLAAAGMPALAAEPVRFSHGLFEDIPVYAPQGEASGAVVLLSDAGGWDARADALARALAGAGATVAGIDVRTLYRDPRAGDCLYPYGDLDNLARNVQAYLQARTVYTPIVAGLGEGGALAYAVGAGAPPATFAGTLSYGFRPRLHAPLPLCEGRGVVFSMRGAREHLLRLLPVPADAPPWYDLQDPAEPGADMARAFLAQVAQGHALAWPPQAGTQGPLSGAVQDSWVQGYRALAALAGHTGGGAPGALGDLPLVPVEAGADAPASEYFAVLVSGDGGWAAIDEALADGLAARGVPVVGVDALRYFWRARTPEGWAGDLERIVNDYRARWRRPRVVLIGFSQGADVMPFAVNRMSAQARAAIARVVLLSPGQRAAFEFRVANWLAATAEGPPVAPEIRRLPPGLALCVYGRQDEDSVCPALRDAGVPVQALGGDHHFDEDYDAVGEVIRAAYAREAH